MQPQIVPAEVDGTKILIEISGGMGEREISGGIHPSFSGVTKAVTKIAKEITSAVDTVKPKKATVEFGCDIAVESGELTALIVKGSGSASLKITLEWGTSAG